MGRVGGCTGRQTRTHTEHKTHLEAGVRDAQKGGHGLAHLVHALEGVLEEAGGEGGRGLDLRWLLCSAFVSLMSLFCFIRWVGGFQGQVHFHSFLALGRRRRGKGRRHGLLLWCCGGCGFDGVSREPPDAHTLPRRTCSECRATCGPRATDPCGKGRQLQLLLHGKSPATHGHGIRFMHLGKQARVVCVAKRREGGTWRRLLSNHPPVTVDTVAPSPQRMRRQQQQSVCVQPIHPRAPQQGHAAHGRSPGRGGSHPGKSLAFLPKSA